MQTVILLPIDDATVVLNALKLGLEYAKKVDGTMASISPERRATRPDIELLDKAIHLLIERTH